MQNNKNMSFLSVLWVGWVGLLLGLPELTRMAIRAGTADPLPPCGPSDVFAAWWPQGLIPRE